MIDPLCQKCQQRINHQKSTPPTPKVSLGLLYHLALDLQFSFQAISLVLDFATIRQASAMHIRIAKINDQESKNITQQQYDENLIELNFDGKPLNKYEVQCFAKSFHSELKGGSELVLGMFGIGKTALFISNDGHEKSVILFSVDDRVNPNYYRDESVIYYIEEEETHKIKNLNGKTMKRVIYEGLRIYHPNPEKILSCQPGKIKVIILHPKIFISSNKIMFYEIRQSNLGHDIDTHSNSEKIQFLNKLGYEMSIHSEFRLSCYLQGVYLSPPINIKIGGNDQYICNITYAAYLQTLRKNNMLIKIENVNIYGCLKVELYEATDKYFMQNNGILLYWKGRLINRFETEFGRMFEQKFYKKKYRSPPRNIWHVVGTIDVDDTKLTPNLIKNRFVNSFQYRKLIQQLSQFVESKEKNSTQSQTKNKKKQDDRKEKKEREGKNEHKQIPIEIIEDEIEEQAEKQNEIERIVSSEQRDDLRRLNDEEQMEQISSAKKKVKMSIEENGQKNENG